MANGNGTIEALLQRLSDRLDIIETSKPAPGASWSFMQSCVGIGAILGFFANQGMWFYIAVFVPEAKDISPGVLAILNQGSGSIMTFAGIVIGYYFGSSKGSQDKDDTAKAAAQTTAEAVKTAAAGTAAMQATVDKVTNALTSTGNGNGNGNGAPKVTVPVADPQPTKEQLFDAASKKFASGQDTEELYRATLQAMGYTTAEIDAAVIANKH